MLTASVGKLVAVARTSDTTEEGRSAVGIAVAIPPTAEVKEATISVGRAVIGMIAGSDGRSVAVASTSEMTEEGRLPTGTPVGNCPTAEVREPTISVGSAVIGMFEASAGRSVAVARTSEMTEEGSSPTGIAVGSAPTAEVKDDRTPDGSAVMGMFDASAGRPVAVASTSETMDEGSSPTGIAVGNAPTADVRDPTISVGSAEIGIFEASAGRFVAVARTSETIDEGSSPTGMAVGSAPTADVRDATISVGSAEIGIFEASAGRFVAVASTSETMDEGSSPTGIPVGRGPRADVREPTMSVGRAVIGMLEASTGRLVAEAKIEDTNEVGS